MAKLLKTASQNKKILIPVLLLGLILTFLPLRPAQALDIPVIGDLIDLITGGLSWGLFSPVLVPIYIGCIIITILGFVCFAIPIFLLKWLLYGGLVTLSFTHNDLVNAGVAGVTSIANLAFILVLVFIGLATILRLESYGLKKLLPKFIFVVLIINFSTPICGAIIDVANIVTNAFLNIPYLDFLKLFNPFQTIITGVWSMFQGDLTSILEGLKNIIGISGIVKFILNATITFLFGLFGGMVFFCYFLIFLFRYIMIWILVILAPAAWFCSILPITQKYYKMWWNYFLQWAFIGALGGFFLKLGYIVVKAFDIGSSGSDVGFAAPQNLAGWQGAIINIFSFLFTSINEIFLAVMVLVFLIIGFYLSLKAAGGGAGTVLKWGEKGMKGMSKVIVRRAPEGAKAVRGAVKTEAAAAKKDYKDFTSAGKSPPEAFVRMWWKRSKEGINAAKEAARVEAKGAKGAYGVFREEGEGKKSKLGAAIGAAKVMLSKEIMNAPDKPATTRAVKSAGQGIFSAVKESYQAFRKETWKAASEGLMGHKYIGKKGEICSHCDEVWKQDVDKCPRCGRKAKPKPPPTPPTP